MEQFFVSKKQLIELKELGFEEPCILPTRPLKSQVFKWFRDKHNLIHNVLCDNIGYGHDYCVAFGCGLLDINYGYVESMIEDTYEFKTYEEAESACIDKLIRILKERRNAR
jgi:hypothetical protein